MTRTTPPSGIPPIAAAGEQAPARGAGIPPDPDTPLWLLRLGVVLLVLLVWASEPVAAWGRAQQDLPPALASLIRGLFLPPGVSWLRLCAALALGAVLAELAYGAWQIVRATVAFQRSAATYLRIRTPNPLLARSRLGENPASGYDLLHAAHRVLPAHHSGAPWLALTMSARPDEPVTFGALVGGGTAEERRGWAASLRQLVIGHNSEADVDMPPDPLLAAIEEARGQERSGALVWADFVPRQPPSYPLRFPDDAAADLIGPLAAALRPPKGVARYAEAQVIAQPRHDWSLLASPWRAKVLRRARLLRAKSLSGLAADARALEEKLDSPAYTVVLRVVIVADTRAQANELLRRIGSTLGAHAARSGSRAQYLSRAGGGAARLPVDPELIRADPDEVRSGEVVLPPEPAPPQRPALPAWAGAQHARRGLLGAGLPAPSRLLGPGTALAPRGTTPAYSAPARGAAAEGVVVTAGAGGSAAAGRAALREPLAVRVRRLALARPWAAGGGVALVLAVILQGLAATGIGGAAATVPPLLDVPPGASSVSAALLPWAIGLAGGLWVTRCVQSAAGALDAARIRHALARAPRLLPARGVTVPGLWRSPGIMSAGELGGIWHLPSASLGRLARWLPCRLIEAPDFAFVEGGQPQPQRPGDRRIVIGLARRSDGSLGPVGPTLDGLRTIMHCTGPMGTGKSQLLANICTQLLDTGFTLLDGKGDDDGNLTETVIGYLRPEDEARVVMIDPDDGDWPIGLNPLAGVDPSTPGAVDILMSRVSAIFAAVDANWDQSPGMRQYLEMATRLVCEGERLPTLAHVKQALTDDAYRDRLLARCTNVEVLTFWGVIYPRTGEGQKASRDALFRRFDNFLVADLLRLMVAQPAPRFSFTRAIEERQIVLIPIPGQRYTEIAPTAAMLMFQAFMRAAFERPGSAMTRDDYPLIVDEFQVVLESGAVRDVNAAITQLRSLGVPAIYAHQGLPQLGELQAMMLINAENRVMMRTQEPDASAYARQYPASGLSAADIAGQEPREHQYARFVVGKRIVPPCSIIPLPWPEPRPPAVDEYRGEAWQLVTPPAESPWLAELDREIVHLVYIEPYRLATARELASYPEDWFFVLLLRWQQIAEEQRRHIAANPGCIPDRGERVRWLSRLGYAIPRLFAEALFLRTRTALGMAAPDADQAGEERDTGGGRRRGREADKGGDRKAGQPGGPRTAEGAEVAGVSPDPAAQPSPPEAGRATGAPAPADELRDRRDAAGDTPPRTDPGSASTLESGDAPPAAEREGPAQDADEQQDPSATRRAGADDLE